MAGHTIRLVLTNGAEITRDIGDLLRGPVFRRIRSDDHEFRRLRVEAGTVAWPSGVDLDPDVLIWGGPPPATGLPEPTLRLTLPV